MMSGHAQLTPHLKRAIRGFTISLYSELLSLQRYKDVLISNIQDLLTAKRFVLYSMFSLVKYEASNNTR